MRRLDKPERRDHLRAQLGPLDPLVWASRQASGERRRGLKFNLCARVAPGKVYLARARAPIRQRRRAPGKLSVSILILLFGFTRSSSRTLLAGLPSG